MTHSVLIQEQVRDFVCVRASVPRTASVQPPEQVCCLFLYLVTSTQVVNVGAETRQMRLH